MRKLSTKSSMLSAAALAMGLTMVGIGPAAAETRGDVAPDHQLSEAKPVDGRPVRVAPDPTDTRPTRDVERLALHCQAADDDTDVARTRVGCEWRAATSDRVVGYQLWRVVDRGDRQMVARVGTDTLAIRDVVPADSSVVRYAVLAVDADGNIVGRSAVERVVVAGRSVDADRVHPVADAAQWPLAVR